MLEGKTILILSPQDWGKMRISKHQYAIEFAKKGNEVYFLNPPKQGELFKRNEIIIRKEKQGNIWVIDHNINFPYRIKFHAISIFHFFMKYHIDRVLKKIGNPIDIVWSFDLGNLYPFAIFPKSIKKIFHPVDEPLNKTALNSALGADVLISITNEILSKYSFLTIPKHQITHGVSEIFFQDYKKNEQNHIQVGISGNLIRQDIDRETLISIINTNPTIRFNFFGAFKDSNIGKLDDDGTIQFIELLKKKENVVFHGMLNQADLAKGLHLMDAFLICYDVIKDQSKGTNYHKVMEFLSTGKVIISNNITSYKDKPGLVQMVEERNSNSSLPILFNNVIANLEFHNSKEIMMSRIEFAKSNTYSKHLDKIEKLIF